MHTNETIGEAWQVLGRGGDFGRTAAGRGDHPLDHPFGERPGPPRAVRRTMQDLAREAGVSDVVTRAISGHATASMQRHYSTARDHEVAATLAALVGRATAIAPSPAVN